MPDIEFIDIGDHLLNALDPRIAEFEELVTVDADQMVVLPVAVRAFVFGLAVPELMTYDQITCDEQFERIVHGSPADTRLLLLHPQIERVGIHVVIGLVDLFEYREPLRSLTLATVAQELRENASDLIDLLEWRRGHSGHVLNTLYYMHVRYPGRGVPVPLRS